MFAYENMQKFNKSSGDKAGIPKFDTSVGDEKKKIVIQEIINPFEDKGAKTSKQGKAKNK